MVLELTTDPATREATNAATAATPSRSRARGRAPARPSPARPVRQQDGAGVREGPVAFVIATRRYRTVEVLAALFASGYSAIERGYPEAAHLLREFSPTLIVAVVDPLRSVDIAVIQTLASDSRAFLLLLAPSADGFAAGLAAGADACLCDGDGLDVLSAQFRSIRRRVSAWGTSGTETQSQAGPLTVDFEAYQVFYAGTHVPVTPMEYSVLAYLVRHQGTVCSPVRMVHALFGEIIDERAAADRIKAFIWRIRLKLRQAGADVDFVRNFRGAGYVLDAGAESGAALV